jgi:hypothetical protein
VGFEPTIAVLERAKTVRALDSSATAIGRINHDDITVEMRMSHKKDSRDSGITHDLKHIVLKQLRNLWIDRQNSLKSKVILYQSAIFLTTMRLFA